MPRDVQQQLGERMRSHVDEAAFLLGVDYDGWQTFARGRNATGWVFADREIPENLLDAVKAVQKNVKDTPFNTRLAHTPEFVLGSVMSAYAIRKERGST